MSAKLSPSLHPDIFMSGDIAAEMSADVALSLAHINANMAAILDAKSDIMGDETKTEGARLMELERLYNSKVAAHIEKAEIALATAISAPQMIRTEINALFQSSQKPADITVASEIRTVLRQMGESERLKLVRDAAIRGDPTVLVAISDAPHMLHGLSLAAVEVLQNEYVRYHLPELAARQKGARLLAARAEQARKALPQVRSALFQTGDEVKLKATKESAVRAKRHFE